MKLLYVAAAAAMVTMASCAGSNQKADENVAADNATTTTETQEAVYTGILPAADVDGINYTRVLDYTADNNAGNYNLTQAYYDDLDSIDSPAYKGVQEFQSEGSFTVEDATPATDGKKHLRLISKSAGSSPADTTYFLIDSDSAITLVGADLQPSQAPGLNYTLTKSE